MGDHNTNLTGGASSVSNSSFNNNTVIGQQINIHPAVSTSAKIGCASIWFRMQDPIPSYTGRQDELKEVHNLFFPPNADINSIRKVAIVGLGGVGKSEFARKFAHKYYTQLDENVAWINAESAQLLIDSFKELATHIGVKFAELSGKPEIIKMVDQVYAYFGGNKSLFIFDNVEDWVNGENAIRDYLPNRMAPNVQKPFILITSRIRPSGIKVVELSVLRQWQAVELIQSRLEMSGKDFEELQLRLANLLGCLPLALQQAALYIKQQIESDCSGKSQSELLIWCIESYIKCFDLEAKKLLGYKSNTIDIKFEELKTTLLTWKITLKRIDELETSNNRLTRGIKRWFPKLFPRKSSKAAELLGMMSYVSPDNIHLKIFEEPFKEDELKSAVNTLFQYSMISKLSLNSSIVSVHRLVQRVVRLDTEKLEGTLGKLLNLLNVILEKMPMSITPFTTSCVIHAQVAWEHALEYPNLLKHFKYYPGNLYNKAALHEMHTTNLSLLERTLAKYKLCNIHQESDEQYINAQHLVALALQNLHKYEDSKYLFKLIHKTSADALGDSHRVTLSILNNLALTEEGLGNYSEQMTILDKVIAIRTASSNFGPHHKCTLISLHNKALCLLNMEKYDEALQLFKSTLELMERHHAEDRKSINHTRYLIAQTTERKGNSAEALPMFRTVHAERVESFGESHTSALRCARQIGECLIEVEEYEEGMEILKHNMKLTEGNPDARLECANMHYLIGTVLFKTERYDEAVSQFRIVLGERLSIYGETHPEVQTTRQQLAHALKNCDKPNSSQIYE